MVESNNYAPDYGNAGNDYGGGGDNSGGGGGGGDGGGGGGFDWWQIYFLKLLINLKCYFFYFKI